MLKKLQSLIEGAFSDVGESLSAEDQKQLAVYGILHEAALSDFSIAEEERETINSIMFARFGLEGEALERIKNLAEEEHASSTDMFQITRDVRKHLSREERVELLDELWQIAFADGVLDPQETVIIRRLADLLGLDHKELIDSKIKMSVASRDSSKD